MVTYTFNPNIQRQSHFKFEFNLGHIVSFSPAKATKWDPATNKRKTPNKVSPHDLLWSTQ